jgi:agmatine/peptidylarginine deiminase
MTIKKSTPVQNLKVFVCAMLFLAGPLHAQQQTENKPDWRQLHYLSEEEMLMPKHRNPDFTETDPPVGSVRMVGEFEHMQAVLIRYPFGIPYTVISEMADDLPVITLVSSNSQANQVLALYEQNNVNTDNCSFLVAATDSYWTRDYGPWFVFDGDNQPGIVDFPYDRPRPNDDNVPVKVAQSLGIPVYGMNLTHTGGNMMADGLGTAASTDLVLEENTDMTEQEVRDKMQSYLGISQYDITLDPLGDYIKHIDCWGKYLAPDKILIGRVPLNDDRYADYEAVANYFETTPSPYGYPYKVYRVFSPGTAPNTPYTNSIILNNKVLLPTTGSQWDDEAIAVYQEAMPGYDVVGMEWDSWFNTDALHCRAIGIADLDMLFVDHRPHYGLMDWQDSVGVSVKIVPYSGEELVSDSLLVNYQVNHEPYRQAKLYHTEGYNYQGFIKNYEGNDTLRYFISAVDAAGNRAKLPYMGNLDPFNFVMGDFVQNDLTITPDSLIFEYEITKQFTIRNFTENAAQITNISNFSWYAWLPTLPVLPYTIESGDSLVVDVDVNIITKQNPDFLWVYDSVQIVSNLGTDYVYLKINYDLIDKIAENENSIIKVSPNPFTDQIQFDLPSGTSGEFVFELFDPSGRKVDIFVSNVLSENKSTIYKPKQSLSRGFYTYRISLSDKVYQGKLLKK